MTTTDPFQHPEMGTQIDAKSAAQALHDVFAAMMGGSAPASSGGLFSSAPTSMTSPASAPASTATAPTTGATGTTTSSPVPQGTAIAQGYGGPGGHPGLDLAVPVGSQILAANSGTVTHAANDDPQGYGEWVEITGDDGIVTRYGHLSGMTVAVGAKVRAGQVIGNSGGEAGGPTSGNSTGPHLHFEVRSGGSTIDPTPFLAGGYQVVGGVSADTTTPTTADPKTLAAIALKNVIAGLTGAPMTGDPAAPTTSTQPGATPSGTSTLSGQTSGADADPAAVDAFLNATKQHESGGDYTIYNQSGLSNASGAYQFLNSTWKSAGGSTEAAAQASPAEQDAVARKMAMDLFNKYHSWRLVAIAWYGGPGVADQVAAGQDPGAPDQQGGYLAYGDTIVKMMSGG